MAFQSCKRNFVLYPVTAGGTLDRFLWCMAGCFRRKQKTFSSNVLVISTSTRAVMGIREKSKKKICYFLTFDFFSAFFSPSTLGKSSSSVFSPYAVTCVLIWTKSGVISLDRMVFLLRSPSMDG